MNKVLSAQEVLLQYMAYDGLKPQYDGMSASEVARRVGEAYVIEQRSKDLEDMELQERHD